MDNLGSNAAPNASFWRGKRVLLTGHSGFKGSWLTLWLHRLGVKVTGVSLPPLTTPNLYGEADTGAICDSHFIDIRNIAALTERVRAARPDIVFHLAAQPLVYAGYRAPMTTFETNTMGTVHLLEAMRGLETVRVAVMVTTDKVYRDDGKEQGYREDDVLGGHDPYSASKAAAELAIASYRDSFLATQGVAVASVRAGNVIGGGDWSDDRLIPDAVRAWHAGEVLKIRRPDAVRPWQHVLEPLYGYLTLAEQLWDEPSLAGAYNFGPDIGEAAPVRELIELAQASYGEGEVEFAQVDGPHETAWLALDNAKARRVLGVSPALTLVQAVTRTMAWHRSHKAGVDARQLCEADIADFEARINPAAEASETAGRLRASAL
jgi:CDP-glucose 4,6-dehydratase